MNNTKILITGATGLLGSYICRLLHNSGYHQISATRRPSSNLSALGDTSKKINWLEGDLTDLGFANEIVTGQDWIIHAAGFVSHGIGREDSLIRVNVVSTERLLTAAASAGIRKFLHVSSIAALGRSEKKQSISEAHVWKRSKYNSPYANSKYLAEMEVWRAYSEGLPVAIINPSVILGAGIWGKSSLVLFDKVWNGLRFFPKGMTGFVDVRDVAEMILKMLETDITGERIIASAENLTFKEVFTEIANHLQKAPPSIAVNQLMTEISWRMSHLVSMMTGGTPFVEKSAARLSQYSYQYDNSKSKDLLSYQYRDIRDTIAECCSSYRESMEKKLSFGILPI